jgi:hypothetical protein
MASLFPSAASLLLITDCKHRTACILLWYEVWWKKKQRCSLLNYDSIIFILLISEYFKICMCEDKTSMSYTLRKEILYNIIIEFEIIMKVIWLIKTYLNETCSKVSIGTHFYDTFYIQNDLNQEVTLFPLVVNFYLKCVIRKVQENQ